MRSKPIAWIIAVAACTVSAARPQSSAALPHFDAVSIKPFVAQAGQRISGNCAGGPGAPVLGGGDPSRWRCASSSLSDLVMSAYGLHDFELTRPTWMDTSRFQITATIPPGTTQGQFLVMKQALLVDRFGLVVHHETKPIAGFEIVVAAGGFKLKPSAPPPAEPPDPNAPRTPPPITASDKNGFPIIPPGMFPAGTAIQIQGDNSKLRYMIVQSTMDRLAQIFAGMESAPVKNATRITGVFDINLDYMPRAREPAPGDSSAAGDPGPTGPVSALEPETGLKLRPALIQTELMIVDHCEKTPIGN